MGHGYTNASDALSAIKLEVFQKRSCSLKDVTEAVDSNFERDPDLSLKEHRMLFERLERYLEKSGEQLNL